MKIQILGTGLLLKRNKLAFCRCYTLVELITVTAILTIVLAIGTVRIGADIFDGGPEQKAEELRRIAAICRRQAAATGKECAVEFDPVERRLYFGKEALIYPEGMLVLKNGEELQEPGSVLRFFPDGSASAAVLAFEYDGDLSILRVSPLTGSMAINEAE